MRTIGLIGGMSWNSSLEYYRIINESIQEQLGGLHSAKCILYSVDLGELGKLQREGKWEELAGLMVEAAERLQGAGADCIVICTNTMHKLADDIESSINIPLLHIADATGDEIRKSGLSRVALLGTKFTMEEDFYKTRLEQKYGVEVVIPGQKERQAIHNVIYDELCLGVIKQSSAEMVTAVIGGLVASGAEGVILGCTELPLLIRQESVEVPVFDTTAIHAQAAVDFALRAS